MSVKRTERGWAGHFICSDRCKFRRNTLLEYGGRAWVVSTVGCLVIEGTVEEIGLDRYYETMAFEAKKARGYIDADVSNPIVFDSPWALCAHTWEDLLSEYPDVDNEANDMHENAVDELMVRIKEKILDGGDTE